VVNNHITSFSKERPEGNPIDFVIKYLNLQKKEAVTWFEDNF
jgi:hypothetical protein